MTTQFTKLTLEEAKELYSVGVINTTTLVLLYFRIRLAQGWKTKLVNSDLIKELGISETSFYRAVSFLRCQGLLFWKSKGVIEYALTAETLYDNEKVMKANHKKVSPRNGSQTPTNESSTPTNESSTPTNESQTPTNGKTTGLESAPDKEYGDAPDSIQIYLKLFSTLLQGRGEDFEKIKSFFEWWISEGIREIGFELKNPVAYLNSEDPLTKEKRLFLQFSNWKSKNSLPEWWDDFINDPKYQRFICLD